MNSTQRLLAAMRGGQPDRAPVSTYELVGWNGQAWENREPSYRRLMEAVRAATDCMYMCGVPVPNARAGEVPATTETWDQDGWHYTRVTTHARRPLVHVQRRRDDLHTTWTVEHPCKNLEDLEAYLEMPWEPGEADFAGLERAWADLGAERGLPLVSTGDPICELAELFDLSEFLVLAMTETEAMAAALDRLHERHLERFRRVLAGPVRDVVFRICGPEYATPPYLPPELFRRFVTNYDRHYVRMIRSAGGIPRIHCHGRTARVIDQIAEMAPDAMDPLEPPPDGDISLAELKKAVGGRICLTGGIELKHLEHADGEFIERLVRGTMAAGKPGGRFILMPTAAPINVPLSPKTEDNYLRFIETALQTGRY